MVKIILMLSAAAGATADLPTAKPIWTAAALRAAQPAAIGDALLPPGHPPIGRADILPEARQVVLYAQPARLDRGFCRAATFRVTLVPLEYVTDPSPEGPRYRSGAVASEGVYRVSAAPETCEPDTRGYFPVSGGSDAEGRSLVRGLIGVKAAASSGGRIPPTTCVDRSGPDGCKAGSRALLAAIRTDAIGNVALAPCAGRTAAEPGSCAPQIWLGASDGAAAYWIASITTRGTTRGSGAATSVARIALAREKISAR